jgi:O-antigen/teichoic acid export membrane protein
VLVTENINASIDSVLLPVLSSEQDNRDAVREMTRRAIKTSSYIMMPIMAGMAVCAEPLIRLLLMEKWLPCVPYMQVFCICYALYPLHTANLNAIKAMGRSDIFLKQEIIKKIFITAMIFATMGISAFAIALSEIVSGIASLFINAWPNRRLLGYKYGMQLRDIMPAALVSLAMAACVWPITLLGLNDFVTLLIQVPLGVVVYVAISAVFKIDSFSFMLGVLKRLLHRA